MPELPEETESLLAQVVISSAKMVQRGAETPAVVSVISSELIQARGYRSLAEVLRSVPGFYDVYDLVTHNIGVRGISGGARASGNVIKLMIDGHPVDFRPTTGNFFGEELIPIELIERVEIIRGPASALYGANAFLGVVNVITRSGSQLRGVYPVGRFMMVRDRPGGGGGFVAGAQVGPLDVAVGANFMYIDRSGLQLPPSSPLLAKDMMLAAERSRNDTLQPKTAFARLLFNNVAGGRLSLLASVQNLDAAGEFQDFGPQSHGTRINLLNQNYLAAWDIAPSPRFSLHLSGHYFNGAPTGDERLHIGRADFVLLRRVAAQGFGVAADARVQAHRMFSLSFGVDYVNEDHLLLTFDQKLTQNVLAADMSVLRKLGTIIPGENSGRHRRFYDVGAFLQAYLSFKGAWSAIAGGRYDFHNIYGSNFAARAGLVYAPSSRRVSVKLLYGSAFKAPSAEQLFATPFKALDIVGNPALQAQNAHTLELYGAYALPKDRGEISLNVFATNVLGRVEFQQRGQFLQAVNSADEWVVGGELDSRLVLAKGLTLRVSAAVAKTVQRTTNTIVVGLVDVQNPLFPTYQFHLLGDYALGRWGLHISTEISWVGARAASQSNALLSGTAYQLPGYAYTALAISRSGRGIIPNRDTHISLRLTDVINLQWAEPGFGGIDVPSQGITLMLTINQQL